MILVMNLNFDHVWIPTQLLHGLVKWIFVGFTGGLTLKNIYFMDVHQT